MADTVTTTTTTATHTSQYNSSSEKSAVLFSNDLELQDPRAQNGQWRQRHTKHHYYRAVAVGILLAIGFWTLCADATTQSLYRMQEFMYRNGRHCTSASGSSGGSSGGGGSFVDRAEQCAVDTLHRNAFTFLDGLAAIGVPEFIRRRDALAKALDAQGVAAFVAEPGYMFEYYTNVSQKSWMVGEPEQGPPLLLVIKPVHARDGSIVAKTAFVAPRPQVGRVRALPVPFAEREADIVMWEEHWDPYVTLRKSRLFPAPTPSGDGFVLPGSSSGNQSGRVHGHGGGRHRPLTIMADPGMRSFIASGLGDAGFALTLGPPAPAVDLAAQAKSAAEVAVLRAVNTASLAAIRAVRTCLVPGLTEANVADMLRRTVASVGMTPLLTSVALFDADADQGREPLGLSYHSIVTVEVSARYMGHSSDVARTFSMPGRPWSWSLSSSHVSGRRAVANRDGEELGRVWNVLRAAQDAAATTARNTTAPTAVIDYAARAVIARAGHGRAAVQGRCLVGRRDQQQQQQPGRVLLPGHHARSRREEKTLMLPPRPGMVLVSAPAVQLPGRRRRRSVVFCLADSYLVTGEGEPELLTGRLSQGLDDP